MGSENGTPTILNSFAYAKHPNPCGIAAVRGFARPSGGARSSSWPMARLLMRLRRMGREGAALERVSPALRAVASDFSLRGQRKVTKRKAFPRPPGGARSSSWPMAGPSMRLRRMGREGDALERVSPALRAVASDFSLRGQRKVTKRKANPANPTATRLPSGRSPGRTDRRRWGIPAPLRLRHHP